MLCSSNILKEHMKQMVLELSRAGSSTWRACQVKLPSFSFFKSLLCLSVLVTGALISGGLKPSLDGVFRDKMKNCLKKKKKEAAHLRQVDVSLVEQSDPSID